MDQDSTNKDNTSGDEFETSDEDPSTILQRLKEFSYYLVYHVEGNLNVCLDLLEEKPVPPKPNSIHTTVVSKSLSAIPKLGTALGNAVAKGESWILEKIDKGNSKTLADLVFYYGDNREEFRKVLIESSIDLFSSFEKQFSKLTCTGGPKRAMFKLAKDASDRILDYLLDTKREKDITKDEITKGVLNGNSRKNNSGGRPGRTVTHEINQWKTSKMYRKTGIIIVEENVFYKNEDSNTKKYGHRRLLPWEKVEDVKENWEQEVGFEATQYLLTENEDLMPIIREYIMTKAPNEEAKLERENYHKESLEDRQVKHDEILLTFREDFKEVLEDLEGQHKTVVENHNENKELLQEMSQKQNEELVLRQEISTKLQEIQDNINDTKLLMDAHRSVQEDIVEIKNKNEELEKSLVVLQPENIQKMVRNEAVTNIAKNLEKAVRETLKKADPGPKINKEVKRNLKKIKKLW